jgi:ribosomal protein S7
MTDEDKKDYQKKYYENYKDKIISRLVEKIQCEHCKRLISRCNMQKHCRTIKCKTKQRRVEFNKVENWMEIIKELFCE